MGGARWLREARWCDVASPAAAATPLVWIALDSPEWRAWAAFWREMHGKTPPGICR